MTNPFSLKIVAISLHKTGISFILKNVDRREGTYQQVKLNRCQCLRATFCITFDTGAMGLKFATTQLRIIATSKMRLLCGKKYVLISEDWAQFTNVIGF